MRSPAARCIRSDGCARAACLCSASLKVVDADPISACKGKSAARWVVLGDPDPPPAENLRSPSRPPHIIFYQPLTNSPFYTPKACSFSYVCVIHIFIRQTSQSLATGFLSIFPQTCNMLLINDHPLFSVQYMQPLCQKYFYSELLYVHALYTCIAYISIIYFINN